jgi:hypothetical protein
MVNRRYSEKDFVVLSRETGSSSGDSAQEYDEPQWETGVRARFPWLGIGSLVCVLVSAGAAVLILTLCDGRAQSGWPKKLTPNVILAGINAFANIMLAIAIGQGVAIAWWRKVLGGATVKDLHHSWGFSTSLTSMVTGWRYLNFIALAALAAKLAIIDSILLQRALQTYNAQDHARNLTMQAPLFTAWPSTGVVNSQEKQVSYIRMDFQNNVVSPWAGGAGASPVPSAFSGCDGVCQGTFEGVGFAFSGESVVPGGGGPVSTSQVNLTDPIWHNGTSVPIFDVSFEMSWANTTKKYSSIFAHILFFVVNDGPDCSGQFFESRYEIRPALLDVDFMFQDYSKLSVGVSTPTINAGNVLRIPAGDSFSRWSSFWNEDGDQRNGFHVKKHLDYPEDTGSIGNTTLGGVFLALQRYVGSSANITYNTASKKWDLSQQGTYALQMAASSSAGDMAPGSCNYEYWLGTDSSVIAAINELAFELTTSPTPDGTQQNVTTVQQAYGIHYKTNFGFMAGAVVSMVLCVILVLPSYWKFWELGRPVSLAPVEIANAFRAPVLDSSKASNAMVGDLLREVGDRRVMFGQMSAGGRLAVEEVGKVKRVGTA